MMENKFFENLAFDLEHSGLLLNIVIKNYGGQTFFDVNYDVDRKLLDEFKKDPIRKKYLFKEPKKNPREYKGKLYELLTWWIGNPTIVLDLLLDISAFCEEYDYTVYSYIGNSTIRDIKYREIIDENDMYSSVIIFESEQKIVAISVGWSD